MLEAARRRREDLVRLEEQAAVAQERWDAVGEPAMDSAPRGPAALLRADQKTVEFTGRDTELGVLRVWCTSTGARSVQTIVGAGGVGKTRLALQVASEWEVRGEWRRIDTGQEAYAVAAARGVTSGPVLLIVDYAESRHDLEALLRAVLADPGPIRVLLVARALGEWWDRLIEKSAPAVGQMLTETEPIRLVESVAEGTSDVALVTAAVPQFARALKCAPPERIEFELPPHRVPVLVLHTAALVAVLRFRHDPAASLRIVVAEGVLEELLEHEARYWRRMAAMASLPEDGALLKPVVAAAALLGAASLAEAADLLMRVPDLADASPAQRRSWARWLYGLYPADSEGRLGSLQPDLLAEAHVVKQLVADTDLAAACLSGLPQWQAERALTVLARAWAHQEDAQRLISEALHSDLTHLALPAALIALQTPSALGGLLATAFQDAPAPQDVLIQIARALPFPSVVLAQAHLAVAWRVLRSLPPGAESAMRAEWSDRVGTLLSQLGRPAEALPATEEAVAVYRELAAANPDRYRPELALSLANLGVRFSELGRPVEALPVTEEAVGVYRELAAADPDRFRPELAGSLANVGVHFWELGRPADALSATEEAVAVYRELAAANPDEYRLDLAGSLSNLGTHFSALGRLAEALDAEQEAVAVYRELAAANPDRYRPDLARSLSNLGAHFSELGRPVEALPVTEEAVAVYRELAAVNPDGFRPELALSLSNLGVRFSELGRPVEALPVTEEAVGVYRELAAANPDRFRPDMAVSLSNLGIRFLTLGRPAEALPVTEEAVAIHRELAAANPDRYRPDLASTLSNLGTRFYELDRPAEALDAEQEAVAIRRELAAANPDRYRPGLARSLSNLGAYFLTLGRPAEALQVTEEAVAIHRELAAVMPGRYHPDLAASLANLGTHFSALSRSAEALQVTEEAVAIHRELAAVMPGRYRPYLARSLAMLAAIHIELGQMADADSVRAEAAQIASADQ